ncbi:unnamed protein product [Dimorphilus gyrociliatus]|nr:unnamed protein product [Dimorphilus gyrociliatus]
MLADHVTWFAKLGLIKTDTTKWSHRAFKFWLLSIIFNLVRDLYELCNIYINERHRKKTPNTSNSGVSTFKRALKRHPEVAVDFLKNSADVVIPLSALGYCKCANKGITGLLGVISSLSAICAIVAPSLKLSPA